MLDSGTIGVPGPTGEERYHSYCFIRTDLPLPVQIVQAGHAWWGAAVHYGKLYYCNFVLIAVPNEAELLARAKKLKELGIDGFLWHEEDHDMGYTALATVPVTGEKRSYFQRFDLYKID